MTDETPDATTDPAVPASAVVLEAIETDDTLRATPTALLCPGCGATVATYPNGLPHYVSHVRETCPACDVDLKRWCLVAIDAAYTDLADPDGLAALVQRYWERHFWRGIQTSGEYPRTDEFTTAYRRKADAFDWAWQLRCPLCRRAVADLPQDRLEYHHWTRGPDDQGVCLCRACHDAISNGAYDNEVDWHARELGLRGKDDLQIARLAARETTQHDYPDHPTLARALTARYNLPYDTQTVHCILDQVLTDDTLRDRLADAGLATDGDHDA